jgi:hypothetical protein
VCSQCEEGLGPITTMGRDATEATVGLLSKFSSFNFDQLKTELKYVVFFVILLSPFNVCCSQFLIHNWPVAAYLQLFVQFVIVLWRGLYMKIIECNVNTVNPRVVFTSTRQKWSSIIFSYLLTLTRVNIKYISHLSASTFPYFNRS